jgi:SAM-dependent methyltransferase
MARAAKIFMQKVFRKKILNSGLQYSSVLDLACGYGDYCDFFKGKKYIGIDSDTERVNQAKRKHPEASFFCSTIEELPQNISADLVICIQTIGFNNYFQIENTLQVVNKILLATNQDGHCFFNVRDNCKDYFFAISNLMEDKFFQVEIIDYGSCNNDLPLPIASLIASTVYQLPILRGERFKIFIGYKKLLSK